MDGKNKAETHSSSKSTFDSEKCTDKDRSAVKKSKLIGSMRKKGLHGAYRGKHVCKIIFFILYKRTFLIY